MDGCFPRFKFSKFYWRPNKALLDFQPATGQLVPQFREGRRHYGWYRDLTLKQGMEVFSYSKSLGFGFSDLFGAGNKQSRVSLEVTQTLSLHFLLFLCVGFLLNL